MCGIVGYIGNDNAIDIVINGLENLEYRGYDSSGIAFLDEGNIDVVKCVGRINNLKEKLSKEYKNFFSNIGIGHTRWATHGVPSDVNSHPHLSMNGKFAVVHNGIIENYLSKVCFIYFLKFAISCFLNYCASFYFIIYCLMIFAQ